MLSTPPRFSILICTVGKEELTRGAIKSILDQDYPSFEIIVTDTSGGEQIRTAADSFNDERIRFFKVPGLDPTISWQFAYEQSTGEYVLWYDDDNRLVPWALKRYAKLIEEYGSDIISGNHVYYFGEGNRHKPHLDNTLSMLFPYSLSTKGYESPAVLRTIYDFSMGIPPQLARWHSAATFVARSVCEEACKKTGYVIAPHMYGNFTFHPIIFTFAKNPIYDDRPLCVIGKFASSITQQWSNTFVQQKRSTALPFRFTGVTERTLGNTTAECYLQVRHDIPAHATYPFNWMKFYRRYSDELVFLTIPLVRHAYAWKELWMAVAQHLPPRERMKLRVIILKNSIRFLVLRLARALHLSTVLRQFRWRDQTNSMRRTAPLATYEVHTIDACAGRLDEIMSREWNISIR